MTTVYGRVRSNSHLLAPDLDLFPLGHSSSQLAISEEGSDLVP